MSDHQSNEQTSNLDKIKALELKVMLYEELIVHQTTVLEQHNSEVEDHLAIIKFQAQYNEAQSKRLTERSHELRTYYNAIQGLSEVTRLVTFNKIEQQFSELGEKVKEFKELKKADSKDIPPTLITVKAQEIAALQSKIAAALIQASANLVTIEQSSKAGVIYTNLILEESEINQDEEVYRQTFDFNQCLEECVDMFRQGKAILKNIQLKYELDEIGKINSSAPHIKIILNNLISNAINYTPNNGRVTIMATIKIEGDKQSLIFIIKDSGNGISQENIDKLRRRFAQNNNDDRFERLGNSSKTQGSGIGLVNVMRCVCLLNGEISVRSLGEGAGATFVVTLPLNPL
ncbi:MAG: signal transduction histidine kinase [Phenylobacterium sp.]|jgi:signal transduction histidine kinase